LITTLIILAVVLSLAGIVGSVFPGLPGPPLNYLAMWCLQWAIEPFQNYTLVIYGVLTAAIVLFDYYIPVWTAKRFGATRQGIIGSMLGMIIGFFFTPVGMILGTIAGAILGDMMAGRTSSQATKSGIAAFFGTFITIGLKLLFCGIITGIVLFKVAGYYASR
jgi:uncharacterized protein YqgC (DUF456 family)